MKRFIAGVLTVVLVMLCAACGKETKNTEKDAVKLTLSEVTHSVFYAPQYVALEKGFFSEEGLEIELINGGGADKVMTSVLTGEAEIGFCGPEACTPGQIVTFIPNQAFFRTSTFPYV